MAANFQMIIFVDVPSMALAASIGLKPEFSIYIIKFDLGHIVFTL
jgi:hypothetical protein